MIGRGPADNGYIDGKSLVKKPLLTVNLQRSRGWAGESKRFRPEAFGGGGGQASVQQQTRTAAGQGQPINSWQNTHLQQSIPKISLGKESELSAVTRQA